jgi:tRNA threonylcarbamoyladenosine biosynthesis protein TsaE
MRKKFILKDLNETIGFGKDLALNCFGGEIFAVSGPLGSGKTSLAQGLALGFNIRTKVNSPTFNIIKLYLVKNHKTIKEFIHIDAYRLKSSQELISLGINDYFLANDKVIYIEWAEKIKDIIPKKARKIKLDYYQNNDQRIIYL